MISVKYLVFITCLNLGIAGYWGTNNGWKVVNAQRNAADDTTYRSKRQANIISRYTIELLMVIDFSLYQFWEGRVRDKGNITTSEIPQDAVRNKIRQFYASMGESINFRFQNISNPYFAISVEVVDIFIADTEIASYWTETSKNISNEGNIYVEGDQSLELFNNWIISLNNLTRHDHAMLFTRYNIQHNNQFVSGLTSGYPVCGTKSVSLVLDHFNSISATWAAKLLSYRLGARSDGEDNQCNSTDNYIMSPFNVPGQGDKALNPWRFSSCSVQAFSTFLTSLNSTQYRTCLQSDDAVAINEVRAFPGSEYSVDEQCRFIRDNSSYLCRFNYEGDFSNICTNLLCYDNSSDSCAQVLPPDGLSCGSGKWCENGRCVNSSRAPNNTDICLFGDGDAICSSLYPSFLQYCYSESSYLICCDTCSRWKQNVSGCEFGDSGDCSQVRLISQCADDIILHICCSTCATLAASACPAGSFRSTQGNCLTCNIGSYQPYLEQSSCITCPSGTTTLTTGSNSSTQCAATCNSGFFRTTNGSCETCPVGTYQTSIDQSSCLSCPNGTTTKQIASTSITQCVDICSAGFFLNNLDTCQACPRGTYQPTAGQSSCSSCQTGTVTLQAGSTSSSQCVATCSSGFFRTLSGSCQVCFVGTYQSAIEQSSCLSCPDGTTTNQVASTSQTQCVAVCTSGFFLNISYSCESCPRGTYQPSSGQTSCISCPTDTVTLQTGSISFAQCVVTCKPGYFRSTNGSCQACPVGTYQPSTEQSSCVSCPSGTTAIQIASTSSTLCIVACSAGFFRTTNGSCQACPAGTYQESIEQSSCVSCPTGTSTNQIASTSRTQCAVNNCSAGTYQGFPGSPCMPCAAGTYQPQPRQSACIQCRAGTYQPNISSTECILCSPGSYQDIFGSSSCISCNSGEYQPDFGQTSCIQCSAGTYQPNIGTSTTCNSCDPGSYQNKTGSFSCVLCEVGTYQPSTGETSCTACPKGRYQGRKGSTMCDFCEAGNYQPDNGKATCIACPSGTYQRQNGSTSCDMCDPGFYQNNTGGSSCNPCEEGYYNSISGDKSCRRCEIGTYQNSTGQSFCFPCPNKYTTQKDGERSVQACFQGYCPEYRYIVHASSYNISVIIPSTKINQTGYSWNRCKEDPSKALVSAFCQNISRTEVTWTQEKVECTPEPDIQDVQTSPISEQLHSISKIAVSDSDHVNILQKTDALIKSVDVLTPVDYGYLADILDNTNMVDTVSKEVLNATLDVIDTLLRVNSSTNQSSQTSPGAPNRILKLVEDITSKTEGGTVDNPVKTIKPNIAVTVWEQVGAKLIGINVLSGNTTGIQENLVQQLHDPEEEDLYDAIYFLPDILNAAKNKIVMTAIWNDALFMSGSDRYKVVSKIMAAKLIQNGVSITHLDNNYITSVFLVTEDDSRIMCGYWDYTLNQNGGGWASDGCNYTKYNERHVCTCNHLTNFAVLVDLDAKTISPEHARALEIITFVGLILSIIGLSLTILTFMCFRHLRRGRGQQTLFCLCIPMVCYSIVFLAGIQRTEYYVPCIVVSVLIHYFILASFMWMLVEGILQYLRFVKVLGTYIPNFLIKTSLPAWGIPLVPVIVMLAYNYNLYYGGSGFCWMKLEALYYAFVLPVSLIILVNAIIFSIVMFNIFRRPKGMKINQSDRRLMVMNLQAGISVFVLLGLTWIFGVVALGGAKLTFQYIFVILNAFQGFFIFLMFTVREKQVRDQWIRFCCRRPTGYFTSLSGRKYSSSQDTFATNVSGGMRRSSSSEDNIATNVSGGMRRSSSSSFMDSTNRKLSSSCQNHRRQSNQLETNESEQDHVRQNSSAQQLERDIKSVDSVVHETSFKSLHEQKKAKTSLGKYLKTSEVNKHKSSNKDDTHELRKMSEHSKSDVTMWGKYLSKSVPDHLSSNYSIADPNRMKKVKEGHVSRSAPDEARSNIILFNSIGRKHNSSNDLKGDDVVFSLGRSVDDIHDKRKRRQITQFRHDGPYF